MSNLFLTFLAVFILIGCPSASAKPHVRLVGAPLSATNFQHIEAQFNAKRKTAAALPCALLWLKKAKNENNLEQTLMALQALMHASPPSDQFRYADTLIRVAQQSRDQANIGSAYLTKGALYYSRKDLTGALDHYLLAHRYLSHTDDPYLLHKLKYALGQTKYYLGYYDEALALFQECLLYFKDHHDRAYLNTLHHLGLCMNKVGKYKECSLYNDTGIFTGLQLKNDALHAYFMHSEGINQYDQHNYAASLQLLEKALPLLNEKEDFANEIVTWFYMAQNYTALGQPEQALQLHKKVDAAMDAHRYIRSDLRKNYEILINQFKLVGNTSEELKYVKKLLVKDSLLFAHYRYLSNTLTKQYDTKKLLLQQQVLERRLRHNAYLSYFFYFFIAQLPISLGYLVYKQSKKRVAKSLLQADPTGSLPKEMQQKEQPKKIVISQTLSVDILKRLHKFEQEKLYLQKEINLRKLADILKTNPKYVSQLIPEHRGSNTITYLNTMKVVHIIGLLEAERLTRNYTMDALAELAGFKTTQTFTTAFKAHTSLTPPLYIRKLNKEAGATSSP